MPFKKGNKLSDSKMIQNLLNKLRRWAIQDYILIYDTYEVTDKNNKIIKDQSWFDFDGKKVQLQKQSFGPSFTDEDGTVVIIENIIQYFKIL